MMSDVVVVSGSESRDRRHWLDEMMNQRGVVRWIS